MSESALYLKNFKIKSILSILKTELSKRDIKDIFSLTDVEFDILIEETNALNEMRCNGGKYSFHIENAAEDIELKDFVKPIFFSLKNYGKKYYEYKNYLLNISTFLEKTKLDCLNLSLAVGEYAEKKKNIDLAIQIYRYTAMLSKEIEIQQRKRIMVKSVLKLSKLEFMRGISPEETLRMQRETVRMITQSNLTSEDALLMLYAGMGEHFAGSLEEGEILRSKGIKYMKQFNYEGHESEAVPLIGWHYYLEGDFRKTVAYYESFILAIENRKDEDIITFAYPPIIFSYFFMGEPEKALALAEMIYRHAVRDKDNLAANLLKAIIGRVYLYLEQDETAEKILNEAYQEGERLEYGWGMYYALMGICYLEERRKNFEKCKEVLVKARQIAIDDRFAPIVASPFVLEALKGIQEENLPEISRFTYGEELKKYLTSKNVHLRGIAYRHLAENKKRERVFTDEIIKDIKASIYLLETSGNVHELGKSYLLLAKLYYQNGDMDESEIFANRAWNLSTENEKKNFPSQLKKFTLHERSEKNLHLELETTWLELREIVNEERQQTRLLSSMCRTFATESGVFAIVRKKEIELKLVQNIDKKNRKNAELQRIEKIIQQTVKTKEIIMYDRPENQRNSMNKAMNFLLEEPSFYLAIPFIQGNYVMAVLYLQSYFSDRRISEDDVKYVEEFAKKMCDPLLSAINYNQMAAKLQATDILTESEEEKQDCRYCETKDDEVRFILEQISKVAKTNIPVLITGETGVGKEMFAREVFEHSDYKKTFIKINCGAIPESLIESELFGYEKGSFTGATQRKKGYFEMAEGGTIFLDEIGELSLLSQVKLLRVLQEHELMRVGGTESVHVDFRLIAATNKDLKEEVSKDNFRKDLFYRLNVVQLSIPPLRKRKNDIPALAGFFIRKYCKQLGKSNYRIDQDTFRGMMSYPWPGNIREMENLLQKAVLFSDDNIVKIDFDKYKSEFHTETEPPKENEQKTIKAFTQALSVSTEFLTLEEMERSYIEEVLSHCGGKIAGKGGAAEILGMKRTTLISRMEKLGMRKTPTGSQMR